MDALPRSTSPDLDRVRVNPAPSELLGAVRQAIASQAAIAEACTAMLLPAQAAVRELQAASAQVQVAALHLVDTQTLAAEACTAMLLPAQAAIRELQAVSAQVQAAALRLVNTQNPVAEAGTTRLLPAQAAARDLQAVSAQVQAAALRLVNTQTTVAEGGTTRLLAAQTAVRDLQAVSAQVQAAAVYLEGAAAIKRQFDSIAIESIFEFVPRTDQLDGLTESTPALSVDWSDASFGGTSCGTDRMIRVWAAETVAALEQLLEMARKAHVLSASLSWLRSLWNRRLAVCASSIQRPQRSRLPVELWIARFLRHSVAQHAPPPHGRSLATVAGDCVPALEVLAT